MMWILTALKTRIGQAVGLVLLALGALGLAERRGGKKERQRASRRADAAAEAREEQRDDINKDISGSGAGAARDGLRADWADES